jgi:hypothetical protein
MKKTVLAALALGLSAGWAAADEITLMNGKTIVGIARQEQGQRKVVIEVGTGTITLDVLDVSSINPGRTVLHDYEERWKDIEDSKKARDYYELAVWCRENKVTRHIEMLAAKAVALEPGHEGARRLLGHEKVGDRWLGFEEAQEARGMVKHKGRWVTKSEKELLDRRELEAKERALAAKAAKDEEEARRKKAMDEYHAHIQRQLMHLDGYFHSPSWAFTTPYFRPYWWAPYVRSRRYYQEGWMYNSGGGFGTFDLFRFIPDPSLRR